mmetsp:Transcript_44571/g.111698  ORF Transcript_44571/g.111698 Transcript_44571/m.111698 type:complete len:208 (+) Transcript_44571:1317-1940(+)
MARAQGQVSVDIHQKGHGVEALWHGPRAHHDGGTPPIPRIPLSRRSQDSANRPSHPIRTARPIAFLPQLSLDSKVCHRKQCPQASHRPFIPIQALLSGPCFRRPSCHKSGHSPTGREGISREIVCRPQRRSEPLTASGSQSTLSQCLCRPFRGGLSRHHDPSLACPRSNPSKVSFARRGNAAWICLYPQGWKARLEGPLPGSAGADA